MKLKLIRTAYHRNGVAGNGFHVTLFRDEDGSVKVLIDFGDIDGAGTSSAGDDYAVLKLADLVQDDLSQRWRGDYYIDRVRKLRITEERKKEKAAREAFRA